MTKYICIKPFKLSWIRATSNFSPLPNRRDIVMGDIIDVDFVPSKLPKRITSYSFFTSIENKLYESSILLLDLDEHFIILAEWREQQINSILND
jgi:hypothetical protein